MQLLLKKIEMATLVLHISIMRKNVKKGFKSRYGKKEGKELLNHFDDLKKCLVDGLKGLEDENNYYEKIIEFSERNITILSEFLNWYVSEVKLEIGDHEMDKEDKEQFERLADIQEKVNLLKNFE